MWGLTAIAVVPLANKWFEAALAADLALATVAKLGSVGDGKEAELQRLYNTKFIQADMLVMGIGGFIAGLAGYPLIGFAWKANAWPGLLAMIGTSFLSYYITGHTI